MAASFHVQGVSKGSLEPVVGCSMLLGFRVSPGWMFFRLPTSDRLKGVSRNPKWFRSVCCAGMFHRGLRGAMLVAALPYGYFYAVVLARLAVIALLFSGDVKALEVHRFVRSGLTLSLKRMFRFLERLVAAGRPGAG